MLSQIGRHGYNGNCSELGGGINIKRLKRQNKINPLQKERESILKLLILGKQNEAYIKLVNCCATTEQKRIFYNKYFI